jgi:hypothetical protein
MKKNEKIVKKITRYIGDKEYEGTMTKEDGKYIYYYPYAAELGKKMTTGDRAKIAKLTGLTIGIVTKVLNGERWNEHVLIEAYKFAKRNIEMGFVTVEEISIT